MEKIRLFKCWRTLLMLIGISLFSANLYAQSRNVSGTVTDEKGEALIGATVKLKSGSLTTSTNVNGKFTISVPAGETALVVTYIGYVNQEIAVNAQSNDLVVRMSTNSKSLNDVVVVGYGSQKKRDVTGSISSVTAATLQEVPAGNVIQQLQGRVAGVDIATNSTQPGAVGQIRIRGERSLGTDRGAADAQNGPLVVLDGIPFIGGSFNDINPDDIASLEILKDASATAIYGSRGASGVIIVTTKRGRTGKATMSYNAYYGITERIAKYNFFNAAEYTQFKRDAAAGNNGTAGNSAFYAAELAGIANGTDTDWQDIIFRKGYTTNHELSLSGGNESTQFGLSGGYRKDKGITLGQDFTRYSLRSTIDHKISKILKVGLNSLTSLSITNDGDRFPVGGVVRYSPLVSPYNADGSINLRPQAGSPLDFNVVNPLTINDPVSNKNESRRLNTFNSLYGEVNIFEGLKYRLNVGLIFNQTQTGSSAGPNTYYNNTDNITQGTASVSNSENWSYTVENILTYDKTFAEKHHVTFTGLYSIEKDHFRSTGAFRGTNFPADYFQDYNLAAAINPITADGGSFSERGLRSYMARLNYVFSGKYSLTATVRTDGTSVFPNKKYFTYPAFAAAWNIDREDFMRGISFISALKLRGGYGKTSNQSVNPYSSLGTLSSNYYNYGTTGVVGYFVNRLANPNLTWEFTNSIDLGLDFGLFKDRITGVIDVYNQKTTDILQDVSLPPSNGASSYVSNEGKTKGQGLEITLSSLNIKSAKGFNWSTDFNIAFNRNTIVQLSQGLRQNIGNNWFVGQPFNVIYDVKKIGIWQLEEAAEAARYGSAPGQIKIQDVNNDGAINDRDLQIVGNFQPKFTGGLTNRFSYKGLDLSIVTFARVGQKIITPYLTADGSAQGYAFFGNGRVNTWKVNYWTPTNPTQDFPRPNSSLDSQPYASTLGIRDGSFVRVRSINLGYNIPVKYLTKAGISSLRVYATCANPFYIWSPLISSGLGIDPEGNGYGQIVRSTAQPNNPTAGGGANGTNNSRAITANLNNPSTRTFQLGVNLKF